MADGGRGRGRGPPRGGGRLGGGGRDGGRGGRPPPKSPGEGTARELASVLSQIDGNQYPAYKDIAGKWSFEDFTLVVDHVQGDAFAAPSRMRVLVNQSKAKIPLDLFKSKSRNVALCDYLTRQFASAVRAAGDDVRQNAQGSWASAKGGEMTVDEPGQRIIERTSVFVNEDIVEARFTVGLPAKGRTALGNWAKQTLVDNLPTYVNRSLLYSSLDSTKLAEHVFTAEDADWLRSQLSGHGLVSFVGAGSVLPRQSGNVDTPLQKQTAVAFSPPETLAVELELPNRGKVTGMGIQKGVTLVVGGGFHGKSTLVSAVELGVYNHIPGDGRELVVTDEKAVKIRAEDGRSVTGVDISPFICNLPFNKATSAFTSEDASGSTSQAAAIQEAIEVGARSLIVDEDTCATNFMIRDERMQRLVSKDKEPITPLIARIRALVNCGISTVMVVGGSGDYFDVADSVIQLQDFVPIDVTEEAYRVAEELPRLQNGSPSRRDTELYPQCPQRVVESVLDKEGKVAVRSKSLAQIGEREVDLACVEQIGEKSQTRAIAESINNWLRPLKNTGRLTLSQILDKLETDVDSNGLDVLMPSARSGQLARPRRFELAAAVSRLRSLKLARM